MCVGGGGAKRPLLQKQKQMNKQKVILFLNKNFLLKMMKTELFRETYLYVPKILWNYLQLKIQITMNYFEIKIDDKKIVVC